jgi:uncharacterized membrane protein YbhN (UPF0104 family)
MHAAARLLQPKIAIPVLLSAALLGLLFGTSDLPRVAWYIGRLPAAAIAATLLFAGAYLAAKFLLWRQYIDRLAVGANTRQVLVAFAVGEMTLSLPAGVYAQNYVLRRIAGADFGRSSAATSAILGAEGGVVLVALLALGVPGWRWLEPSILVFFALAGAGLACFALSKAPSRLASRLLALRPLNKLAPELRELAGGLRRLATPGLAALAAPTTVVYLSALVAAFWVVGLGVGTEGFGLEQAASIYLFGLGVVLLNPISSQLGVMEASGLEAMQAWGYSADQAFAALLAFRLVWTAAVWLICGAVVLALGKELNTPARQETS